MTSRLSNSGKGRTVSASDFSRSGKGPKRSGNDVRKGTSTGGKKRTSVKETAGKRGGASASQIHGRLTKGKSVTKKSKPTPAPGRTPVRSGGRTVSDSDFSRSGKGPKRSENDTGKRPSTRGKKRTSVSETRKRKPSTTELKNKRSAVKAKINKRLTKGKDVSKATARKKRITNKIRKRRV